MENALTPLEGKEIRKAWSNEEWFFSVVDVVEVLTDSKDPQQYWKRLNQRDKELKGGVQIVPILFNGIGGKQKVLCTNRQGILRLVMSVPSLKAEPLKQWLAQVGTERLDEFENPELSFERMTEMYRLQGRTDEWIKERIQSIETRKRLTDEWKNRGVKEGKEYANLTAIIAKGTFELTPTEHKDLKGLTKPSENLRDHMTPLELIFTSLGEELTRDEAVKGDAQGFNENKTAAVKGGSMAGKARKLIEDERGQKVVSTQNFLKQLPTEKPKEE
jgi:DNA-damage-inducible protein D